MKICNTTFGNLIEMLSEISEIVGYLTKDCFSNKSSRKGVITLPQIKELSENKTK